MTQHELVIEYIKEHGSILPAKLAGVWYKSEMFGSETSKRCRELRSHTLASVQKYPRLVSEGKGKFTVFAFERKDDYIDTPEPIYNFNGELLTKRNVV